MTLSGEVAGFAATLWLRWGGSTRWQPLSVGLAAARDDGGSALASPFDRYSTSVGVGGFAARGQFNPRRWRPQNPPNPPGRNFRAASVRSAVAAVRPFRSTSAKLLPFL